MVGAYVDAHRGDRPGDGGREGIPRGTTARTARIAALPLAFTGRAVAGWGRRLAGADPETVSAAAMERNAEQLFAVLGQLRGGAMKVGQALAVYESMMPAELAEPYRRALVRLQTQGPAMPAREVHRVLDEQLGRQWRTRLPEFDDVPTAAASIGQVHRARTAQGRPVAVKVQYPGADQALETDLRVLERFARLFTLIVPGLDARAVMRELRTRTLEELDYRDEADHQRAFAAEYGGGEHLHVPAVVASSPKVLVQEWLDGTSLARLVGQPDPGPDRDRYAHTIVETMFSSPVRVGMVHADPHPGNFLVLRDGRLGMVDFGAVAAMPGGVPPVLARTLRHIADGEPEQMMTLLRAEGFIHGDIGPDEVLAYIGALADPLRVPHFRFDRAWMAAQGARVADLRGAAYRANRSLASRSNAGVIVRYTAVDAGSATHCVHTSGV